MAADVADWPDDSLKRQAGRIGSAVLELIDAEWRWVHRRVERIELPDTAQATRSVAADITVPLPLADRLRLYTEPLEVDSDPTAEIPPVTDASRSRLIVPLGMLKKAPLEDFSLTPDDCQRLSAEQTTLLVWSGLAPTVRRSGVEDPNALLVSLARLVRSETPAAAELEDLEQTLTAADQSLLPGFDARSRLRRIAAQLSDHYILTVAIDAAAGLPTRVTYTHRQTIDAVWGSFHEPPLVIEHRLPYASGTGPDYAGGQAPSLRVEIVAPDGLEIETASIVEEDTRLVRGRPVVPAHRKGAYVHLKAPDGPDRPKNASLIVTFAFPAGGIQHLALVAGLSSSLALVLAVIVSFLFGEDLKATAASALLAAPALVTGLALGFTTTRVTSGAVDRLRLVAGGIALLGVFGGLAIALLSQTAQYVNLRHGVLVLLAILSIVLLFYAPVPACMRQRAIPPPDERSSES